MERDGGGLPWPLNAYTAAGVLVLFATLLSFRVVTNPLPAALAQALLPVTLGISLVGYGLLTGDRTPDRDQHIVRWWMIAGVLVFTLVGIYFYVLSELFETAYLLAVLGSLSTGVALGAVIGTYAVELRRANRDLAEQNDRLEEFASIVSHDLRNPLSVASGMVELADGDDARLDRAAQALQRMDHIIEDVLMLARGIDEVETRRVTLGDIATKAWQTADAETATLTIEGSPEVEADDSLLRELLENLFRNAIEHGETDPGNTPHGSAGVTVSVGPCEGGFYVEDDGPGIPPAERDTVFEAGHTTGDGSGLGLHIVERICEVHGWNVTVTESEAGGARFEFTVETTASGQPCRTANQSGSGLVP